jgi:RNA polymerase sigma-70 factor (ECF subfamily)
VITEFSRQLSDHELVADAQAGDAQALDTLIAAVRPAVFRYCRSRLATYAGGVDAADDVTQETCIAVVKVLPSYRRQGPPFEAFVRAIASHKVADMQRQFGRSAVLIEEFPDQTEPSPTPEDRAIAIFDVRAANQLLALLPPRMREVLVLRAAGLSATSIGERFGLSANAVRVSQHRASARLRELIAESEEHREMFDSFRRTVA